ncbi:hypothetical protein ACLOJK_022566 [Asimina triloba]
MCIRFSALPEHNIRCSTFPKDDSHFRRCIDRMIRSLQNHGDGKLCPSPSSLIIIGHLFTVQVVDNFFNLAVMETTVSDDRSANLSWSKEQPRKADELLSNLARFSEQRATGDSRQRLHLDRQPQITARLTRDD